MHKTRRLMDENSVSFQMFLILLPFIILGFFVWGEHAQKPKFGDFSVKKNS